MRAALVAVLLGLPLAGCLDLLGGGGASESLGRLCRDDLAAEPLGEGSLNEVRFVAEIRGMPGTLHMCVFGEGGILRARTDALVTSQQRYTFDVPVRGPVHASSALLTGDGVNGGIIRNHMEPDCGANVFTNANYFDMQERKFQGGSADDGCTDQAAALLARPAATGPLPRDAVTGALMVGGIAGLGALAWRRGWLGLGLFTRLVRPKLLDQQVRARVHDALAADPGQRIADLARTLELSHGHTAYHVRVLAREGVLAGIRIGGRRHYFVVGALSHAQMRRVAALQRPSWRKAFAQVQAAPGSPMGGLAQRLDWSVARTSRVIEAMERAQIVRRSPQGRQTFVFPA